jgi:hypothetical protein
MTYDGMVKMSAESEKYADKDEAVPEARPADMPLDEGMKKRGAF